MKGLTRYEMETLVSFNVAEEDARVYTHDKRSIPRFEQMVCGLSGYL